MMLFFGDFIYIDLPIALGWTSNHYTTAYRQVHDKEIEETDVSIHSHPWGSSKFGAVTFDTFEKKKLNVHYRLVVDGKQVWEYNWAFKR